MSLCGMYQSEVWEGEKIVIFLQIKTHLYFVSFALYSFRQCCIIKTTSVLNDLLGGQLHEVGCGSPPTRFPPMLRLAKSKIEHLGLQSNRIIIHI